MFAGKSWIWWTICLVALLPLLGLGQDIANNSLGANPVQALHIRLGDWALRLLWLTLAITPLQMLFNWRGMADYRQLLGLYSWFYASLHVIAYLVVDHGLQWSMIFTDMFESPYIWFGLGSYLILLSLALTSTKAAKRILAKRWKPLHRLIYLASVAAILHYYWQLKGNLAEPLWYVSLLILMFAFRAVNYLKSRVIARLMIPRGRAS
jgi:sulfoxide reductase heme-binding subunit YedZ